MALDWTREELILALAVYFETGADISGKYPDSESVVARELSTTLRRLSAYPTERQPQNYRTGSSVRRKLANFAAAQTAGLGLPNGNRMDAAILWEFFDNRDELIVQAAVIRAGIDSGELRPRHPDTVTSEVVPLAAEIEIERHEAAAFEVKPSDVARITRRAEAQLVHEYRDHMASQGIEVRRMKYEPPGEAAMYSDAWVSARNLLIEAKSTQARDALRQAIGQLYDYRRFHQPARPVLAILLSYQPTGDREALLEDTGIGAIWPRQRGGFQDNVDGAYV
jgi:hypothetical protein